MSLFEYFTSTSGRKGKTKEKEAFRLSGYLVRGKGKDSKSKPCLSRPVAKCGGGAS